MRFWKKGAKGICPECGFEIEDLNDNFCGNCGWKISGFKAINAKTEKESELKIRTHAENIDNYNKNAEEFKQSISDGRNLKEEFIQSKSQNNEIKQVTSKSTEKLSDKTKVLLEKYGLVNSDHFFECTIEEMRFSTLSNANKRDVQHGFVGVYEDKLVIAKQGVFIKSDLGSRTVYFKNIASIDHDARGIFDLSGNLILNMKSNEHVQFKNINEEDSLIVIDTFNKFMEKYNNVPIVEKSFTPLDELLKAKELLDAGLLTKEEFNNLKEKLL